MNSIRQISTALVVYSKVSNTSIDRSKRHAKQANEALLEEQAALEELIR